MSNMKDDDSVNIQEPVETKVDGRGVVAATEPPPQMPPDNERAMSEHQVIPVDDELVPQDNVRLRRYPSWVKYLTAILTIITGSLSSIATKWQNEQDAPKCGKASCKAVGFEGALAQTMMMFIGEAIAFIFWYFDDIFSKRAGKALFFEFNTDISELKRKSAPWYYWPGASACDFTATVMIMIAQQNCSNAVVTMLRNFMVVMSGFSQMAVVRKALLFHEWLGILLITAAMVFFAVPKFTTTDDNFTTGQTTLGIVLTLIGTAVQSFQLLYEEWILRKGRFPATKAVGVEGFGGILFCLIAYGPFQKTLEDVTGSIHQIFHSGKIGGLSALYIFIAFLFNIFGLATTKLGGGVLRGVCFAVRAPVVWVLNIIAGWDTYDTYCLLGTIVFAFGFFIYTNFLPANLWFKPLHMCCTDPKLDGVAIGHELKAEERAQAASRAASRASMPDTEAYQQRSVRSESRA